MSEWNKTQVMKLIELYEQCPCLYNVRNKDYHNRIRRENALQFICKHLESLRPDTVPSDIKTKIKNIRSQYAREKNEIEKSKKSGMGTDDIYTPKLYFFEHLTFLDDFKKCTQSDSNVATQQLVESGQETTSVSTEMPREVTRAEYVPKPSLKRKKSSLEDDARKALKMIENFANIKEDEFDIFGKFMATELRNITDKVLYHETKWKIIQVMTEGVRRQLDMNSSRDVGPSTSSASSRSSCSRSGSDANDHNYYYSGVSVTECDEHDNCDN